MKGCQRVLLGLLLTSSLAADGLAQTKPGDPTLATIEDPARHHVQLTWRF
jgi:hypothetical protein